MQSPTRITDGKKRKYASVFADAEKTAVKIAGEALARMFDNADEALLDFANKAENNELQMRFFHAMGELRHERQAIMVEFLEQLRKGFADYLSGDSMGSASPDGEELSLLDQDIYEEHLALHTMSVQAEAEMPNEIYGLRQRLAMVNNGIKIDSEEIPAGPYRMAVAFGKQLGRLDIETKVKLVCFVLFDRYVMPESRRICEYFNKALIRAGVLPHLKSEFQNPAAPKVQGRKQRPSAKKESAPDAGNSQPLSPSGPEEEALGEELFHSLQELLTLVRLKSHGGSPAPEPAGVYLSAEDLVGNIGQLQSSLELASPAFHVTTSGQPRIEVGAQLLQAIRSDLLGQRNKIRERIGPEKIDSTDANTMELVGLLFEYLLDDRQVPDVVKALISHLHTPYLKLALLDQSFLVKPDHPARLLLNLMVDTGERLVTEEDLRRGIFHELQAVVGRVLNEFRDDVSLFSTLHEELADAVEKARAKAEILEQRTREAEQSQQNLLAAKERAAREIDRLVSRGGTPEAIAKFLRGPWRDRLILLQLRSDAGKDSPGWDEAIRVAELLVWAASPKETDEHRLRLEAVLPELGESLRKGTAVLGSQFEPQVQALLDLLTELSRAPAPPKPAEGKAVPKVLETAAPVPPPEPEISPQEQVMIDRLGRLEFGTWFKLTLEQGAKPRHGKLSWFNPKTGRYMFVDQSGVKIAVKTVRELANDLLGGRAEIVHFSELSFLDRALQAIHGLLRKTIGG